MSVNSYPKMIFSCSISSGVKSFVFLSGCVQRQMCSNVYMLSQSPSTSCCLRVYSSRSQPRYIDMSISSTPSISSVIGSPDFRGNCFSSRIPKQRQLPCVRSFIGFRAPKTKCTPLCQSRNMSVLLSKQGLLSKIRSNMGSMSWSRGFTTAGLLIGLLISYSTCKTTNAEAAGPNEDKVDDASFSRGKRIFMDYSVIGIPGDGRCLFRSIVHGVSLRAGKAAPSGNLQRELADDLRSRVADEFVKRREETEWFIEGDFDSYVLQMRRPHVWGGEPELLMASHVLQMPITVYMHDANSGGLISIAEYGQEYGKENPIRVLYHGFGHYDALQVPGKGTKARM